MLKARGIATSSRPTVPPHWLRTRRRRRRSARSSAPWRSSTRRTRSCGRHLPIRARGAAHLTIRGVRRLRDFDVSIPMKSSLRCPTTRPPCMRLCPAYPGNPRRYIEGESPHLWRRTYSLAEVIEHQVSGSPGKVKNWNGERTYGSWHRELTQAPELRQQVAKRLRLPRSVDRSAQNQSSRLNLGRAIMPPLGDNNAGAHPIARGIEQAAARGGDPLTVPPCADPRTTSMKCTGPSSGTVRLAVDNSPCSRPFQFFDPTG
jgi:hypothetical protein